MYDTSAVKKEIGAAGDDFRKNLDNLRADLDLLREDLMRIGADKAEVASGQVAERLAALQRNASAFMETASAEGRSVRADLETRIKDNPIGAVGVAVAAGFVLGKLLFPSK